MLTDRMEDYLKAIYTLQREDGPPVSTSAIAEYLDVTSPTVASTVEKLAERGLVEREKYAGVEVTAEGERVALEVLRHHRLLEAFLTEELDYDWTAVHDEADRLEHHISEEFERRVAARLGDPDVDPHGDPIPDANLTPPVDDGVSLADAAAGDRVRIARVDDRDAEELRYLHEVGVVPGAVVEIVDVAPFGMVTVSIDGDEQSLPESVAASVRVDPVEKTREVRS
ncbi:DtxR family transcriptional regulator [Halobacteriales archaeon SW_7_68_16]|nr:MAG: DtxR family transcriptional regulator [Halobacteriales archaeon SW_7_68_16]